MTPLLSLRHYNFYHSYLIPDTSSTLSFLQLLLFISRQKPSPKEQKQRRPEEQFSTMKYSRRATQVRKPLAKDISHRQSSRKAVLLQTPTSIRRTFRRSGNISRSELISASWIPKIVTGPPGDDGVALSRTYQCKVFLVVKRAVCRGFRCLGPQDFSAVLQGPYPPHSRRHVRLEASLYRVGMFCPMIGIFPDTENVEIRLERVYPSLNVAGSMSVQREHFTS